jgi:hypothetical protein
MRAAYPTEVVKADASVTAAKRYPSDNILSKVQSERGHIL